MTSDLERQRAEKVFNQRVRGRHSRKVMAEYEVQAVATRKKTARLKALRLAKEAQSQKSKPYK